VDLLLAPFLLLETQELNYQADFWKYTLLVIYTKSFLFDKVTLDYKNILSFMFGKQSLENLNANYFSLIAVSHFLHSDLPLCLENYVANSARMICCCNFD
jgi:hypothetical protein